MSEIDLPVLVALAVLGLLAGVGITAIGPGGVLATIGLFALTDLSPGEVAGTALVTHVATGALATAAYHRSGHLGDRDTRRAVGVFAAGAVVGTPIGVLINAALTGQVFGILLAVFAALVGLLVLYRDRRADTAALVRRPSLATLGTIGLAVAVVSGVFGVGGPMLSVPLLIAVGVPVLSSLAVAQAQSVVIASIGSLGYLAVGAIDWPLALLVGIPELAGVIVGWRIARSVPTHVLKYVLVGSLFALAPYLALHG